MTFIEQRLIKTKNEVCPLLPSIIKEMTDDKAGGESAGDGADTTTPKPSIDSRKKPEPTQPKRFHGTITLDATRVGRDAGNIAEEVISHLSGLVGAKVTVTLEIEAKIPQGVPDQVVRTVTENARTLKFTSQGFEKE